MSASQAEQIAGVRPILRRVVTNAGMLLGGRTINAVVSLIYMAIAARSLGLRELGVLVLVQAFAQFLGDVVKFQSWQTMIHYGARALQEGDVRPFQRVLRFTVVLDLAGTVLGIALGIAGSFLLSGRLGWTPQEAPGAAVYMLSIAFMVSATPIGLLRLFDRFDVMARQAALISILRLIGSGMAVLLMPTLGGFLLAFAFGTVGSWLYLAGSSLNELRRRRLLEGFSWRGPLGEGMPGVWRFAWNTNLTTTLEVAFTTPRPCSSEVWWDLPRRRSGGSAGRSPTASPSRPSCWCRPSILNWRGCGPTATTRRCGGWRCRSGCCRERLAWCCWRSAPSRDLHCWRP